MGRKKTGLIKKCEICGKETYYTQARLKKPKRFFCSNVCHGKFDGINKTRWKCIKVPCGFCGKITEFPPCRLKNAKTLFCSKDCYHKFQSTDKNPLRIRRPRKCVICEKEYEVANHSKQKCCSIKCGHQYIKKTYPNLEEKKGKYFKVLKEQDRLKIDKTCLHCKETFRVWNYRKNAKFCSNECKDNFRRTEIICATCGEIFIVPNFCKNRKYCSETCAGRGLDKRKSKFFLEILNVIENIFHKDKIETEVFIKNENYKYSVDIVIDKKIAIECFGDYWHCNPIKYNSDYFHSKIRKTAKEIWQEDNIRTERLSGRFEKFLIIWEKDWKMFPEKITENLYEIHKSFENI